MPEGVRRYFEVSLLLMLGASFFTLASTGKLDPVSVAGFSIALLVRLWSYARQADWTLTPRAVTRLAIIYVFFYPLDLMVFSAGSGLVDRMLEATVHLILFATVVKAFSARTGRDYGYLASLSFLMMLASAVLTVSTVYVAGFALYLLFAISAFISYEITRSSEAQSAGNRDSGFGIREGRVANPEPRTPNPEATIERALMATALALAAGIVLVATLLFFLIPRYRSGYLNGIGAQPQNLTGFSESVDLGDIGKLLQSDAVVMRVVPEGDPKDFSGTKWRGIALTRFDGRRWYNHGIGAVAVSPISLNHFVLPAPLESSSPHRRPRRYHVLLAPTSTGVLFAAAAPREVIGPLHFIVLDDTGSLHDPGSGAVPLSYEVVSETALPSPAELRLAPAGYPAAISLTYLALPKLDPRIAALARQVTSSAVNNYDRAVAIESYLRANFGYTLNPPSISPSDPIGSFLFKSKQGYCEYFAGAMAVMLRSLRIPARLVNGFQTGSYNPVGQDFVVRALDAHSWVEAYFPGHGWVPFDPTPRDPETRAGLGALGDYLDAANLFWNEWIVNYDFTHQVRLAQQIQIDSQRWHESAQRRWRRFKWRGVRSAAVLEQVLIAHRLLALALMLVAMALVVLAGSGTSFAELRLLLVWKFRRRDRPVDPRAAALVYEQFLRAVRRRGFRKSPAQTSREFAAELAGTPLGPSAVDFTTLYNSLRFGVASVPLGSLRDALAALREAHK
ncbi:MAG TPA: DUF3488 and transglutaminase-like domain-containing protein [Terriglobia bacterium]|nr:DUF3488 and transglutaminase-like domain-containing protein [Terriglobia bacterium]